MPSNLWDDEAKFVENELFGFEKLIMGYWVLTYQTKECPKITLNNL